MQNNLILIKKRPDFLRAAKYGQKVVKSGLVLQVVRTQNQSEPPVVRIGYTASKKVGNAVCRNRAKRRLRALCAELFPLEAMVGYDYVIIARHATINRPYQKLYKEMKEALLQAKTEFNEKESQKNTDKTSRI